MSETLPNEIQVSILRLLDGDLQGEEVTRLDAALRASRAARALFLQLAALHSALESQESARVAIRNVPVIPIERVLVRQRQRPCCCCPWPDCG
jgi:predicted anti-sigma-YlaC factor YlaD